MQDNFFAADHQGVSGIIAPLIAHDVVGVFRVDVNNLALAFIAPLGAHYNHICHVYSSPWLSSMNFIRPSLCN